MHEFGGIVDDLAVEPVRQQRLDFREHLVDAGDHLEQIGRWRHQDADIDRLLAVEADLGLVILGAERDIGDVFEPHDGAAALLDHQIAELFRRMQAGGGGQIDLHHLAFGVADAGYVIVGGERLADIGRGEAERRELLRIEPGAQRKDLLAEQLRGLHPRHRLQLRLHHARQVIGDLVRRQSVAVEADIHGVDGLADLYRKRRLQRAGRQLVKHRSDLGVDLGQRLVGVVIEPQRHGDGADAALADRVHVVDAVGLRDGIFQRRGDEARDHIGIGAVIDRGDGDERVFGARELQDRQHRIGPQAEHQDQQADDRSEHRPADKNVGELHDAARYRSSGTFGAASAVGVTELSISTVEPLCSLSWPEVTIRSPSLTPLSTAT